MPAIAKRVKDIVGHALGAEIIEYNIEKALQVAKDASRPNAPQSVFYDPLTMFTGYPWLMKSRSNLTYFDLRAMARNPILSSIIQTRINQVATFAKPQTSPYEVGFLVRSADPQAMKDSSKIRELQDTISTCGLKGYGDRTFEHFMRKFVRDSLILDQACAEVVNSLNGKPAYWMAVDSATIRRLRAIVDPTAVAQQKPIYAQVLYDRVVAEYTDEEMVFGIRNPQSDIDYAGYGMSEMEVLIRIVTTILNTEKYNAGQLTQGGTQKGVLILKGDADQDQFRAFKRDFREALRNAADAWRPPVLQIAKDANIDWVPLDRSNRDMEWGHLFDFLVKQACAVYQIAPEEINWTIGGSHTRTNFEARQDVKVHVSQRKGLLPILSFVANSLNENVMARLDPRFKIEFVGLDSDRGTDATIRTKEVQNYKTVDEVRADLGLPPLKVGGDLILNQFYIRYRQQVEGLEVGGDGTVSTVSTDDSSYSLKGGPPETSTLAPGAIQDVGDPEFDA